MNAIEIADFQFVYPDGTAALQNVGLEVAEGERVALLGANGSGKSTLLLALAAILRGSGSIRICGTKVERRAITEVRGHIGFVFQDPDDQLFMPTILEDVTFGPLNYGATRSEADQLALAMLDVVGVKDLAHKPAARISHGQRKRAALATALVMKPDVLLLDEPTSGLDALGRRQMIALLAGLEQTCVFATHDIELVAELADRIVVMQDGQIACDGPAKSLLASREFLEQWGLRPLESYIRLMTGAA